MSITFSMSGRKVILRALKKKKDNEGFIVDNEGHRVLDLEGNELEYKNFAGVIKGSEKYIRDDFHSLVELSHLLKSRKS